MDNNKSINHAVIDTLAYYRALGTPLTLVQISRYPISPKPIFGFSLSQVNGALNYWTDKGIVEKQRGLYWLKKHNLRNPSMEFTPSKDRTQDDNNGYWFKFIQREKFAQRKINKVRWTLKLIRFIPGLRGLFICGSVARKVSRRGSDIDFLILTEKGRVWTARFFLTVLAFLLGKKTRDKKKDSGNSRRDKFCLNHYRSEAKLKLRGQLQDLYSAQEYSRMINVYSDGKIENEFLSANKKWMGKFLPNFDFRKPPIYSKHMPWHIPAQFGNYIERLLQKLQTAKISKSSQKFSRLDNRRIVSDNEVIMFHLNPRAPLVLGKYKNILDNVNYAYRIHSKF